MLEAVLLPLARWVNVNNGPIAWLTAIGLLGGWWLVGWTMGALLIRHKVRPARVIILARLVFLLIGSLAVFDLVFVPVVLFAVPGLALACLLICFCASVLYVVRVDGR